ncbi:MAG TPA: hypothetical protein PLU50_02205 [Pseudobdellovibrionaceae bacterium]|nr:hypothetical protein [Pseudobdellovibrionaceae bacterium]
MSSLINHRWIILVIAGLGFLLFFGASKAFASEKTNTIVCEAILTGKRAQSPHTAVKVSDDGARVEIVSEFIRHRLASTTKETPVILVVLDQGESARPYISALRNVNTSGHILTIANLESHLAEDFFRDFQHWLSQGDPSQADAKLKSEKTYVGFFDLSTITRVFRDRSSSAYQIRTDLIDKLDTLVTVSDSHAKGFTFLESNYRSILLDESLHVLQVYKPLKSLKSKRSEVVQAEIQRQARAAARKQENTQKKFADLSLKEFKQWLEETPTENLPYEYYRRDSKAWLFLTPWIRWIKRQKQDWMSIFSARELASMAVAGLVSFPESGILAIQPELNRLSLELKERGITPASIKIRASDPIISD